MTDPLRFLSGRLSRRSILKLGLAATAAALAPAPARALAKRELPRKLALYNTHTGEAVRTTYWSGGKYLPESLTEIHHVLRDHRNDQVAEIHTGLLDLLSALGRRLGNSDTPEFHVISGYRSPQTNEMLRLQGRQVAKNSLHLVGKAIDIRVPGKALDSVRKAAVSLRVGGVGYYPTSEFVHVDTGRVRYW